MNGLILALAMVGQQCQIVDGRQVCPTSERVPRARVERPVTNAQWSNLVVQIRSDTGSSVGWGTGTVVAVSSTHSLVVTAAHVVSGNPRTITVIHPTGNYAARVLKTGHGADLAALETAPIPNVNGIAIAEPGSKLGVMFGFGSTNRLHQHSGTYLSAARRLSDVESDNRFSFASDQGDSGGPVINANGELFGILWGGDSSTSIVVSTVKLRRFLFDDEKCFRFFKRQPRQINVTITNPPVAVTPLPMPAPIEPMPVQPAPIVVPAPSVVVGPPGPAGPVGAQGPSGPVGPQGPAGVPGTSTAGTAAQTPALVIAVRQPDGTLGPPKTYQAQMSPSLKQPAYFVTLDLNPPPTPPTPANP